MDIREEINNRIQWEKASKAGIVLGLVSSAYLLLSSLLARYAGNINSAFLVTFISMALWSVKFLACIGLMKYFLIRLKITYKGVDSNVAFKFGVKIALLSAFVYSVFYLANLLYISNDVLQAQMDLFLEQAAPMMDSNTAAVMDKTMDSLPTSTTIFNLIYCTLFGTVLSKVLSKALIPDKDFTDDEETK